MDRINERRVKAVRWIFFILMILLVARVWYIQVCCHDEFEAAAVSQYEVDIQGLDTRGMILDRNLRPLTGGISEYYYIIKKSRADATLHFLIEDIEGEQVAKESSDYYVYRTEIFNSQINSTLKENFGAYVFESRSRYADDQIACHLLGYLNEDEQRGVSGIELMYQQELEPDDSSLAIWADVAGNILKGVAPSIRQSQGDTDAMEVHSVVTTIDRRIQYVCENALGKSGEGGAAVVMEAETGEILAWASSPTFNPNRIETYLEEDGDCLIDKVCQGTYAPGSVFKIVTAAAALEEGVCDETQIFQCQGKLTIEGVTMECSTGGEDGHGELDMTRAMAQSCNCYFAQLGELVGCDKIVEMARNMGLGDRVFENFPQEASGNIPDAQRVGIWDTTNISIGQGEILVTPLQMARVTAIVASKGREVSPCLVASGDETPYRQVISRETAEKLDMMLAEVMTEGTGKDEWPLEVKGKTGTAEATWQGRRINNCWFTGYFSLEEKTYVVTVMVERGISGTATAMPVFKAVTRFLSDNL